MKCYYCNRKAVDGLTICYKHRERKNADRRLQTKRRKEKGLCIQCGKNKEQEKYTQCDKCRAIQKRNYINRRKNRLKNNLCTLCGLDKSSIPEWTNTRCPYCHFKEKFGFITETKEKAEQIIINLLEKQNYRCSITGRDLKSNKFHIDHIIPRSLRPEKIDDPENWQLIVEDANFFKKDKRTEDLFSVAVDIVKYAIEKGDMSVSDLENQSESV